VRQRALKDTSFFLQRRLIFRSLASVADQTLYWAKSYHQAVL